MGVLATAGGQLAEEGLRTRAWLLAQHRDLGMFTLAVAGSSKQTNADVVWSPLFWALAKHEQMIVRYQAVPEVQSVGVGRFVQQWCRLPGHPWNADPGSRFLVLEQVHPDQVSMCYADTSALYAFPSGRYRSRTLHAMALAWARGIPVVVWHSELVGRFHNLSDREGMELAKKMLGWR